MGFKVQELKLHGPKYKAQIYYTWPKYKTQIILNYSKQFIHLENLYLMLHVLQSDLFRIGFGPGQMVGGPNKLRWTPFSRKLLIHHLTLYPLYSLTKMARACSISLGCIELTLEILAYRDICIHDLSCNELTLIHFLRFAYKFKSCVLKQLLVYMTYLI